MDRSKLEIGTLSKGKRKAHEMPDSCDTHITLTQTGRPTKFSNPNRAEDLPKHYINLPAEERHHHTSNAEMLAKLRGINCTDENKLIMFLKNHIKVLEIEVKRATIELKLVEAKLRGYEPKPDHDLSLSELLLCEKNLKASLQRVTNLKKTLLVNSSSSCGQMVFQREQIHHQNEQMKINRQASATLNSVGNEWNWAAQSSSSSQLPMPFDHPRNVKPYSNGVFEKSMVQGLCGHTGSGGVLGRGSNNCIGKFPITASGFQPIHQSGMSLTTPQVQSSPNYAPMQGQSVLGERTSHPYQPMGVLDNSSLSSINIQNRQSGILPKSHMNANPNGVNWFNIGNYNTSQNLNVSQTPLNSERAILQKECEPIFTNIIASSHKNNGDRERKGKRLVGPTKMNPKPDCSVNLMSPTVLAEMENATSSAKEKKETNSWEYWDGFALAENLNSVDDLDMLF